MPVTDRNVSEFSRLPSEQAIHQRNFTVLSPNEHAFP
jgi:hypothetical protein